jgi:hypothetical protein
MGITNPKSATQKRICTSHQEERISTRIKDLPTNKPHKKTTTMFLKHSLVLLALLNAAEAFAPVHSATAARRLVSESVSSSALFAKENGKNKKKKIKDDGEDDEDLEMARRRLEMQWQGHSPMKKSKGIGAPRFSSLLGPPPAPASGGPMGGSGPMNDLGARQQPNDWIEQRTAHDNQEWRRYGQQETEEWKLRNGYVSPVPMQPPQYHQPRPHPAAFGGMPPSQVGRQTAHEQIHDMPPGKDRSAREQMFRIHHQLKSHPAFAADALFGPETMRNQERQPFGPETMQNQERQLQDVDFYNDNEEFVDEWIQDDFERFGPPSFGQPIREIGPMVPPPHFGPGPMMPPPHFGPAGYRHPQEQQRPGPPPQMGRQTAHEQVHAMPKGNDRSARDQMFRLHYQLKNHPGFANDALFGPQDSNDDERNPRGMSGPPMFDDEGEWGYGTGFNRGPGPKWTP